MTEPMFLRTSKWSHSRSPDWSIVSIAASLIVAVASLVGCTSESFNYNPPEGDVDAASSRSTDGASASDPNTDRTPCAEALSLEPSEVTTAPEKLTQFEVSGGTGAYQFEFVNRSGGAFSAETAIYTAGPNLGQTDIIRVTDEGCDGGAEATIDVHSMRLEPDEATLSPGTQLVFEVEEGSGSYEFGFVDNQSGAEITSDGSYTAGDTEGRDIVGIEDTGTGERREAEIHVSRSAPFAIEPSSVFLPVGHSFELEVRGGSGSLELQNDDSGVDFDDGTLTATEPTRTTLTFSDQFTGRTADLRLRAVGPTRADLQWVAPTPDELPIVADVDIDRDGHTDAVVGMPTSNIDHFEAGAVYIYEGTADGYESEPARIIRGPTRKADLGKALAVGDVTADGLPDLVAGAPEADNGLVRNGFVRIYAGVDAGGDDDQFFSESPVEEWSGEAGYRRLGQHVALCDFNADDTLDIAVAAPWGQNRNVGDVSWSQGMISVYLSRDGTFLADPDTRIFGEMLTPDGDWEPTAGMTLGRGDIAAGDVDGDGACDLAVGSERAEPRDVNRQGMVYLFRGRPKEGQKTGGISRRPVTAWRGSNSDDRIGSDLSVGDLDDDGDAELVFGNSRVSSNDNRRAGGVHLVDDPTLGEDPAETFSPLLETADWRVHGSRSWQRLGRQTRIQDVDGDDLPDLLIGNTRARIGEDDTELGTVDIHKGRPGDLPDTDPTWRPTGESEGGRFGFRFGVGGDRDGDGMRGLLVYARRSRAPSANVGEPHWIPNPAAETTERTILERRNIPGGSKIGESTAFVPNPSDQTHLLAVGASAANHDGEEDGGRVLLYKNEGEQFDDQPTQTLEAAPTEYASHNNFGNVVRDAGDFDGDGLTDIAVGTRDQTRRTDLEEDNFDYADAGGQCDSREWGTGGVYLYRGTSSRESPYRARPDFLFYGPHGGARLTGLAGNLDVDGDGYQDLVYGSRWWERNDERTGGFGIAYGRSVSTPGKTEIYCRPDYRYQPPASADGSRLGKSIATVGDLDGDGCDEFATGANRQADRNRGRVWIVFGWNRGGSNQCAYDQPHGLFLAAQQDWSRLGETVAGGDRDVTGDGVPDLAVGSTYFFDETEERTGAAWIVPGSHLQTFTPRPLPDTELTNEFVPLLPKDRASDLAIFGRNSGSEFSGSLALVPSRGDIGPFLAVGAPSSGRPGTPAAGALYLYPYDTSSRSLADQPSAIFGGETRSRGSKLGSSVAATAFDGSVFFAVGAPWAESFEDYQGAAFVHQLP